MHTLTEQDILALEREYWDAVKNKDVETAARLSDDPCIIAGAQGVRRVDRSTLGQLMKSGSYELRQFSIGDNAHVQFLGDNVAVVAYDVHEELIVEGEPVTLDAADASTWVRRDGRWVCALHTESIKGDPMGRDRVSGRIASESAPLRRRLSEMGKVLPHLRYGAAVSPAIPDPVEEPPVSTRPTKKRGR